MRTADFDFQFPENLIAYEPLARGESRMMVVDRDATADAPTVTTTGKLADFLHPGDALVLNDTKVLRARLIGENADGFRVEALLLGPFSLPGPSSGCTPSAVNQSASNSQTLWEAMVKPAKRFKVGDQLAFSPRLIATVMSIQESGTRLLGFDLSAEAFHAELEVAGKIPLPPYIKREASERDAQTYQSVFAAKPGSVAAPTASLHLSEAMLAGIRERGVGIHTVTLHVGAGTFRPVQSEDLADHPMHSESFDLSEATASALNEVRRQGGRVWAVGTTAARVLETQATGSGTDLFQPGRGETRIFIYPGYAWKGVDGLLTNFHWPKSTLFMLVCSLLGTDRAKRLYAEAFAQGFRLFSYGDAMLIR